MRTIEVKTCGACPFVTDVYSNAGVCDLNGVTVDFENLQNAPHESCPLRRGVVLVQLDDEVAR